VGEFVRLEVSDGVGTIRLDRPPANAIDHQVGRELSETVSEAGTRDDVRAVVIWGGPKIFAAGADIKEMAELGPEEIRPIVTTLGEAIEGLESLPLPVIAAINGYALGGGCELSLAADLRYVSEDALLGQPEVRIGVFPGAGGTQRLPRLVGIGRAKELIYTGRRVDAREAVAIGLANRVLSAPDVYPTALNVARGQGRDRRAGQPPPRGSRGRARGLHRSLRVQGPARGDARLLGEAGSRVRMSSGGEESRVRVRQATASDVPALVALFQELDAMQRDWRVFTPRPGFFDEVGLRYRAAIGRDDELLLVAEDDAGEIVGMAYGAVKVPSRFSDERALDLSGVVVRVGHRGTGVGRALVGGAASFASARRIGWITLNTFAPNRGAMAFWESMGFTPRVVQMTSSVTAIQGRIGPR
jgi:enoyl-CoA hydratase